MSQLDTANSRRNAQVTRERIIKAADAHFARKPLSSVPLKAIAKDAGVSAPLIIKYFGSKEGLLVELIDFSHFKGQINDIEFDKIGALMADSILFGNGLNGHSLIPLIMASLDSPAIAEVISQRFHEALGATLIQRIHRDAPGEVSEAVALRRAQLAISLAAGYLVLATSKLISDEERSATSAEDLGQTLQHIIETA